MPKFVNKLNGDVIECPVLAGADDEPVLIDGNWEIHVISSAVVLDHPDFTMVALIGTIDEGSSIVVTISCIGSSDIGISPHPVTDQSDWGLTDAFAQALKEYLSPYGWEYVA